MSAILNESIDHLPVSARMTIFVRTALMGLCIVLLAVGTALFPVEQGSLRMYLQGLIVIVLMLCGGSILLGGERKLRNMCGPLHSWHGGMWMLVLVAVNVGPTITLQGGYGRVPGAVGSFALALLVVVAIIFCTISINQSRHWYTQLAQRNRRYEDIQGTSSLLSKGQKYIYLLESNGAYKIGLSASMPSRLQTIRNMSSETVYVVYMLPVSNPHEVENRLHKYYADRRDHGEWFKLTTSDIVAFPSVAKAFMR